MMKPFLYAFVLAVVVACGGGNSDGLSYEGLTTPAVLSPSNAVSVSKYSCTSQKNSNALLAWADSLLALPGSGTYSGDCSSGTVTIVDSATSASLAFRNYCDSTRYGDVNVNGAVSGFENNIGDLIADFSNLTIRLNNVDLTMDGTAKLEADSMVLDMIVRDNNSKKMYKQENFVISNTGASGRLYMAEYGYVNVTTPVPISANALGEVVSGELLFSDANQTDVSISFSNNNYTITLDENGASQNIESGAIADFCL